MRPIGKIIEVSIRPATLAPAANGLGFEPVDEPTFAVYVRRDAPNHYDTPTETYSPVSSATVKFLIMKLLGEFTWPGLNITEEDPLQRAIASLSLDKANES